MSSDRCVVVAGKDAHQNELLVKRYPPRPPSSSTNLTLLCAHRVQYAQNSARSSETLATPERLRAINTARCFWFCSPQSSVRGLRVHTSCLCVVHLRLFLFLLAMSESSDAWCAHLRAVCTNLVISRDCGRYMRSQDVYVHADVHGAATVIIRNDAGALHSPSKPRDLHPGRDAELLPLPPNWSTCIACVLLEKRAPCAATTCSAG